ncbi:RebB family R body protein [Roseateles chitinivorans]|uniref:RebB family R body protein n=1 Tax=Roseateles chitinivorans TaxID=2917965 RepID=UPI003D67C86B
MIDESTVNSQIVDSVSTTVTLATGQAPSQAHGMIDAVLLETLGMAMYNAVNRQQSSGMISAAAVTSACARILTMQPPAPPPPAPPPPPSVNPLPGPAAPPASSANLIAGAMADGQTAIQVLQAQSAGSSQDAGLAQKDLLALAAAATAAANTTHPAA